MEYKSFGAWRSAREAIIAKLPDAAVQASTADPANLVGLHVRVYNNFWRGYEGDFGRTSCPVVARCLRPFHHPDGRRTDTYLIEYGGRYFPIKHSTLLTCLSSDQRARVSA